MTIGLQQVFFLWLSAAMMTSTNAVRSSNHSRCSPNTPALDDRKINLATRLSFLSLIIGSLLFLVGCGDEPTVISTSTDSWYQAVDKDKHEFILLPRFLYSPVKAELIDEVNRAMGDGPLLQLSTKEAIRYADNRLRTVPEFRPFLIHGLYRTKRLFNISIADRALWVDSLDDPTDTAPVRRQPLVLYMDEVPPDVYVTVAWQTAENAAAESAKKNSVDVPKAEEMPTLAGKSLACRHSSPVCPIPQPLYIFGSNNG